MDKKIRICLYIALALIASCLCICIFTICNNTSLYANSSPVQSYQTAYGSNQQIVEDQIIYDLSKCQIKINGIFSYTGKAICPPISVMYNGQFVPSDCYFVNYSNNINAGSNAVITISKVERFSTGTNFINFTIIPQSVDSKNVSVTGIKNFVYNGALTSQQDITVNYNGAVIDTFEINYLGDRVNAGKVNFEVIFSGNYTGKKLVSYTIERANRNDVTVSIENWIYGQAAKQPKVQNVIDNANIIFEYSKFQNGVYTTKRPTDAGTYYLRATVSESQNYNTAVATCSFEIGRAQGSVTATIDDWTYGENANIAKITSRTNQTLGAEVMYRVYNSEDEFTYKVPTNAGKYEAKIVLQENENYYQCETITSFIIYRAPKPNNIPQVLYFKENQKVLSDVNLPAGWKWENPKQKIEGESFKANIIKIDQGNYLQYKFEIELKILTQEMQNPPVESSNNNIGLWVVGAVVVLATITAICVVIKKKKTKSNSKNIEEA